MSTKYWQRADLSGWQDHQHNFVSFITDQVKDRTTVYNYVSNAAFEQACPDLVALLETTYGKIERVIVFKMTQEQMQQRLGNQSIHVDSNFGQQDARLNWPILNPASVMTKYFEIVNHQPAPHRHLINPPRPDYIDVYDPSVCQEVDRVCIDEPTIFSVVHPHSMFINGDQWPRIMASINFHSNVLGEILQKHAENS